MKLNIRFLLIALLPLLLTVLAGCGGGGGSDDDDSSSSATATPDSKDVCSLLGLTLKIINGTGCSDLANSPVVRVITRFEKVAGYCSGTLITPTKVLTAGHCAHDINNPNDPRIETVVLTGGPNGPEMVTTSDVTVHPGFDITHLPLVYNDMAIVTLSHAVSLPTLPVLTSTAPVEGDEVEVFGYGRTVTGTPPGFTFDDLLAQPLDLEAGEMTLSQVSDTHYRAESIAGQTTLCHGDSGGPMIFLLNGQPTVAGVVSQVVANGQTVHCAPGTYVDWTKLQNPTVLNELLALVPDVQQK